MRIKTLHKTGFKEAPPEWQGKRFGMLVVIGVIDELDADKSYKLVCKCDCGWRIKTGRRDLRRGKTTSCGCTKGKRSRLPELTDKIKIGEEEMYFFQFIQKVDLDLDTLKNKITRQRKTLEQIYNQRVT